MKWVDGQLAPVVRRTRTSTLAMIAELQEQPGVWAEVATYPSARRRSAWSRGSQTCRRYPELEYNIGNRGDQTVLYFRIAP